ncbi:hypothetical protein [Methylocystis echinoides]|uniref:Uncharacterized protein n=1 Tax=Methylocystis echinoides TaxID=29468 RepID=A0A9W6GWF8_9HYPH|nr:hypothetical protein [Methylocystis echinoides]GLI94348.1 hypothetical protein LMG27198_33400 [Methylocystis echinoides]
MLKTVFRGALAVILLAAPALARDGFSTDYGHNANRHAPSHRHNRSGAWIGNNQGHVGGPHGRQWGHDHFSPRGQGGHHWGW